MLLKKKQQEVILSVFIKAFRYILLAGLAFILLYPILYMLTMSFRPYEQVKDPLIVWIPKSLTFQTVLDVSKQMKFGEALKNTSVVFVVSALIEVISCSLAGYGFARFKFPFKNIWFIGVVLSILVPPQSIIIPQVVGMRYFDFAFIGKIPELFGGTAFTINFLDTPWATYLPAVFAAGIRSGLFVFIYRQFFLGLPAELEDAAYIDGCGPLRTFLTVMLPVSGGAIIIVLLLSFVAYWNDSIYTTFFYDKLETLNSQLAQLQTFMGYNSNNLPDGADLAYKQCGAMLVIFIPLIVFIIFQRFFTESIERTGIVG